MKNVVLRLAFGVFLLGLNAQAAMVEKTWPRPAPGTSRAVRESSVATAVNQFHGQQVDGKTVDVRIDLCAGSDRMTCLYFKEGSNPEKSISIADDKISAAEIGLMGFHFPGTYEALYVYATFWAPPGATPKSAVFVIDPNQSKTVATVDNKTLKEYNYYNTYFSLVKSPDSRSFPFLAPGQKYITGEYWNYLCLFDSTKITQPDIRCGTGFRAAYISFRNTHGEDEAKASGFRHNRGWLQDMDNDGWDDINIPYFKYIKTISGKTGKQISLSLFDMAEASEPNSMKFFHSGRYYAGYTTFKDPKNGDQMTLFTAGSVVGSFENWNCSVSRYTAAVRWTHFPWGHPENNVHGRLAWSDYVGFSKTLFQAPYDSLDKVIRRGEGIDHCIHRFSDSMLDVSGTVGMAYTQFNAIEQFDCEEFVLNEQRNHFDEESMNKTRACFGEKTKAIRGRWNIYVRNATTGEYLANMKGAYLWGRVANFIPGEPTLLVVENYKSDDGLVRFDKANRPPETFNFNKFGVNFAWATAGTLDNPGYVPRIENRECYSSQSGNASSAPDATCGTPELVVRDIDGDGLNDFQLATPASQPEKWVGYSAAAKKVVLKTR